MVEPTPLKNISQIGNLPQTTSLKPPPRFSFGSEFWPFWKVWIILNSTWSLGCPTVFCWFFAMEICSRLVFYYWRRLVGWFPEVVHLRILKLGEMLLFGGFWLSFLVGFLTKITTLLKKIDGDGASQGQVTWARPINLSLAGKHCTQILSNLGISEHLFEISLPLDGSYYVGGLEICSYQWVVHDRSRTTNLHQQSV